MRILQLIFPAILFAVVVVGCIVDADTYSDQSPFSVPDTLQTSGDEPVSTETPEPTDSPTPAPTATLDKDDYIPTATAEYPPSNK